MGNCIKKESSMQWGGDDWSDDYSDHLITGNHVKTNLYNQSYNNYKKIREEEAGASTSEVKTEDIKGTTQVKLKITRKQLEELLKVESTGNIRGAGGVSLQQVLAHLIDDDDQHSHHQHHSWRPHLPTITEL